MTWEWYEGGQTRHGKRYYGAIKRNDDEKIKVDHIVVFNSTPLEKLPLIGEVKEMWETLSNNTRWVKVMWCYLPQEIIGNDEVTALNWELYPNALFKSREHTDTVEIDKISHRVKVLNLHEYLSKNYSDMHTDTKGHSHHFYHAGVYRPRDKKVFLRGDVVAVLGDEASDEA